MNTKMKILEDLMKRFGFTLSFLMLVLLYSCFSQTQDKPAATDDGKQPKLEIVGGDTHDWKDVTPKDSPLNAKIKIKNTGESMLIVSEVRPACGCTTAPISKDSLMPGEEATLDVSLRIQDKTQNVSKTITISSNDPQSPKKILYLKANVIVPLEWIPRNWFSFSDMKVGYESVATLTLKNNSTIPVKLQDYSVTPENVNTNISRGKVLNPGEEIQVTLRVKPTAAGNFNTNLTIKTNHPDFPELKITGSGKVKESELFNNSNTSGNQ
jgi:hypothetical protein